MVLPGSSFTFRNINSLETYGIKVIAHDAFNAPKRRRDRTIPFRDGVFDYGRKFYDPRIVRLDCVTETKVFTKSEMREIIDWLSEPGVLILWDEPEKFYVGELLEKTDIRIFPNRIKQQFEIPIKCPLPFARKALTVKPLQSGTNYVEYEGTHETPTEIILRNPNNFPVTGIYITEIQIH